jgi:glycerophosphoryl diester phosphodiesterase
VYLSDQPPATVADARVLATEDTVSRLSTLLDAVPEDVLINVELKNPGTTAIRPAVALGPDERQAAAERWRPFVESVLSVTDPAAIDVLFSSFCEGALAALEALAPDARVAALVGPRDTAGGLTHARRYDVDALHVPVSLARDRAVRTTATDLDAAVNVHPVTDWQDATAAVDAGADGLIADHPALETYARR